MAPTDTISIHLVKVTFGTCYLTTFSHFTFFNFLTEIKVISQQEKKNTTFQQHMS